MFNTGTVVGFNANIFGGGFPPKHIPSFGWWDGQEMADYKLDKALETATKVVGRRNLQLSTEDVEIFNYIFNHRSE
jgi:hypothetical protein